MRRDWGQRLAIREGRIGRVLVAFMLIGFVTLIAAVIVAGWANSRSQRHTEATIHTYRVEVAISDLHRLMEQGETTRRGYLLSPDTPDFRTAYRDVAAQLPPAVRQLAGLTQDNPRQRASLTELRRRIGELTALRDTSVALVERGRTGEGIARFRGELGTARMRAIRAVFDTMRDEEQRLLALRDAERRAGVRVFYAVLAVTALLLLAVAIVSLVVVLRYTRDLAASRDSLTELNENLEAIVGERTADLSRANDEIQRFAYIVSHDLRSPLVNVMGFTAELETAARHLAGLIDRVEERAPELADEDATLAAREDLPEAIGFIRTSTQRMDRLINAILVLSRQGRRVLTPEPVDLPAMVETIRGSLAHRLEDEDASIVVEGALPAIVSDRLAIEQILSNLIENAIKYRHPARAGRVIVRGAREGARVWIEVADNGRGIDPRDHDRVFDLFRRSGQQDQPGEGIGLAHVRALAYRLGGVISLTSTLGEGSAFRLSLPITLEPQEKTS